LEKAVLSSLRYTQELIICIKSKLDKLNIELEIVAIRNEITQQEELAQRSTAARWRRLPMIDGTIPHLLVLRV
jgi:hypothetical protein